MQAWERYCQGHVKLGELSSWSGLEVQSCLISESTQARERVGMLRGWKDEIIYEVEYICDFQLTRQSDFRVKCQFQRARGHEREWGCWEAEKMKYFMNWDKFVFSDLHVFQSSGWSVILKWTSSSVLFYFRQHADKGETGDSEKLKKTRKYFMNWDKFVIFNLHFSQISGWTVKCQFQ